MLTNIFQEQFPKQSKEGLYQNKVTLTLASIHNCKNGLLEKKESYLQELEKRILSLSFRDLVRIKMSHNHFLLEIFSYFLE